MIACLDVDYKHTSATVAGILFCDWPDASPVEEQMIFMSDVEPYQSGQFFVRELPCLLAVLRVLSPVEVVIVDGYVWLEDRKPGLGAHLHDALGGQVAVIGVAKTRYLGAEGVRELRRGSSTRPLFISAAGMSVERAAGHVRSMHGSNRIPTLLKRVDLLSRRVRGLKQLGKDENGKMKAETKQAPGVRHQAGGDRQLSEGSR